MATSPQQTLVMDLDGTLIRSDTTHELLVLCLRWQPFLLPLAILKLLKRRSAGKRWLVERFGHHIDPKDLPYEQNALSLVHQFRENNQEVWLVSGADDQIVKSIASHLGVFARAQGSTTEVNLTAANKTSFLTKHLSGDFAYAGNSTHDIDVWKSADRGYGFNAPSAAYALRAKNDAPKVTEVIARKSSLPYLRKTMRLHQWMKNILIFVVPGLMLSTLTIANYLELLGAFICFGFMASGTYILNDLFDIPDDRKHATKKMRQIAAGNLSVPLASFALLALISSSVFGAFLLDEMFGWILILYALTTIAYSFRLKRLPVIDVFVLSALFTIRVWAGAFIVDAPPSAWLTLFIGLVFLSLALAKRYVEISKLSQRKSVSGRGYQAGDEPMVLAFGSAAANAAVISLAIYGLLAPSRLIDNPTIMTILAAIVAGWFMRIWLVAVRGQLNDDPVLFAVKDKVSLLCLFAAALLVASESLRPIWIQWF